MDIRWSLARKLSVLLSVAFLCAPGVVLAEEAEPSMLDKKLDAYWGEKREIRTIQKRLFLKDTRWAFSAFGGVIPNDDFQIYIPMGGRIAYFLTEDIGIEASGAYALQSETDLRTFLTDELEGGGGASAQIFLTQFLDWYANVDFLWSPFHGKFGAFTSKLFHFDFYTAVGVGVNSLVIDYPGATPPSTEIAIAGNVGLGTMMYVLDWMAIRVDYRHFIHEFKAGDGLSYPAEISLGAAFFTPAPK